MSLYTHFARKEQLLDLMFDRILEHLLDVPSQATWERDLEGACRHARKVLLVHPHWLPLLTRVSVPPLSLAFYDRLVRGMRKEGFAGETAMHAFSSVLGYTLGAVLVERMMSSHHHPPVPVQRLSLVREMLPRIPGRYSGLRATARNFDAWSFDSVFALGVHSLVTGLQSGCARGRGGERKRRGA